MMITTTLIALAVLVALSLVIRFIRTRSFAVSEKVFLITGGSRGLGLVLAREICRQGGKVVLLARDMEELTRAEEDLLKRGGFVLAIACDLQKQPHIEAAIRRSIEHFGRIDVLINNAG